VAPSLHPDANAILARLRGEGVTTLYHFTSVENLRLICEAQGLCSKQMLENRGKWPCPVPGGEGPSHVLDRRNGNWDMVHLNFTPYTPMAYGKKQRGHLCFFCIHPQVASWIGVVFTDTNAASDNHLRGEGLEGLNYVNFEIISSITRGDKDTWKRYVQAEVLVPRKIPFEYVSEVAFVSRASMIYAERLCGSLPHPKFSIDERLFTDSIRAPREAVSFPYVRELLLTDAEINTHMLKDVVYLSHIQKNRYSNKDTSHIKVVGLVRAITGTQAKILLRRFDTPDSVEHIIVTKEFETPNLYSGQIKIPVSELAIGVYTVEYYLNNICWASTDFEVVQ